jgi:hypothetical protein
MNLIHIVFSTLLLMSATPLWSDSFTSDTPTSQQADRIFVGHVDLAGLVPAQRPGRGTRLLLTDPEHPLRDRNESPIGYIPTLFRRPIEQMRADGVDLYLEVDHLYHTPRPGKFIRVTLWARTHDLSRIRPLIYRLPLPRTANR